MNFGECDGLHFSFSPAVSRNITGGLRQQYRGDTEETAVSEERG